MDSRDLLSKFRSKKDLYDYLDQHCMYYSQLIPFSTVQMYLPSIDRMNKDFLREVFAGKKHLIPRDQLRPISVPEYDELSVKNLWAEVIQDKELSQYFPSNITEKNLPPREYFFNVINTVQPNYIA
jgi:hypothetical protein